MSDAKSSTKIFRAKSEGVKPFEYLRGREGIVDGGTTARVSLNKKE